MDLWSIGAIIQTSCRLSTFEPAWNSWARYESPPVWGVGGVGHRYSQELDEVVGAFIFDVGQPHPQIREIAPNIQLYS